MGFNPHAKKAPPPPELPPRDGTSDISEEEYVASSVGMLPNSQSPGIRRRERSIDTE
jgi:hypothetical protein